MVSAAEKHASENEIFTFGRGSTQISRSSVQKRRFNQSMTRPFVRTDFFNRIGRFRSVPTDRNRAIAASLPDYFPDFTTSLKLTRAVTPALQENELLRSSFVAITCLSSNLTLLVPPGHDSPLLPAA
ncbi:hypothetical protein CES87_05870 [Pseudomonas sp. ERMR1:02]|nr:hypothetical protein CES87_05870 [Pseudomonas sp. ERMR1:02]